LNPPLRKIDLHTHSTASDGTLSPAELVVSAKARGIVALSITDHDTFEGVSEALEAGQREGVRVVSGVELSVDHRDGSIHLLGYGFDHCNKALIRAVEYLIESRNERNLGMIKRLSELGFSITLEDVRELSKRGALGRAHLAQWLYISRQVGSIDEAFDKLIGKGKPAYLDRKRLDLSDACSLIHAAGGVTVWAHPGLHKGNLSHKLNQLQDWKRMGLDGLESDYSGHSIVLRDMLRLKAKDIGMIFTGGSDFHGDIRPSVQLGDGPGGEDIAYECWENLNGRLKEIRGR